MKIFSSFSLVIYFVDTWVNKMYNDEKKKIIIFWGSVS